MKEDFSDLKPGDEVVVDKSRYGVNSYELKRVDRITPSGRIVIGGAQFKPSGDEFGGDQWWSFRLLRVTPELRQEIADAKERERLLTKISKQKINSLPLETLRAIVALLPSD